MTTHRARLLVVATLFGAMLCASHADAQMSLGRPPAEAPGEVREVMQPPALENPGKSNTIVALLVVGVTAALCVGMVILPGRRSYED